jgi:ribosome modulation factor
MTDHEAFEQGYDDYWDGLAREDNPYEAEKEPEKHRWWEEGWLAARKHDYDERDG